ncbi:MAG: cold shock domain-containing protein [Desulfobacteraceae bacterium]|jgi:CspA family cold shock protein
MAVGVVSSFNDEEGFGFIESDEGEKIFVHHSNIVMEGFRTLAPGTKVSYDKTVGKRGQEAINVHPNVE